MRTKGWMYVCREPWRSLTRYHPLRGRGVSFLLRPDNAAVRCHAQGRARNAPVQLLHRVGRRGRARRYALSSVLQAIRPHQGQLT